MLSTIDLRGRDWHGDDLVKVLPRARFDMSKAVAAVEPILADVAARGAEAIGEYTRRFDGCEASSLRVEPEYLQRCLAQLDPAVREALEVAIDHNRRGHEAQLPRSAEVEIIAGGVVTQRWIPVRRVGLYVPGGLAVYPSSVVMNVVAAQVAKVDSIAVASPPQPAFDGKIHPTIAAACSLLGVDEVYAMGGAQAIGGFAYGFRLDSWRCDRVDVITGPGNIFVAAAKRCVQSVCGIDAEAGTTEIAIIADVTANARYVARDLISQAEHDPAAAAVLITDCEELAGEVSRWVSEMMPRVRHCERVRTALSGAQSGIILTENISHSVAVANAYAGEHLEIHTADPHRVAQQVRNAGAIFIGPYTPVPLGDYAAGSNHVLPTAGSARYASGLGVHAFIKSVQQIEYSASALERLVPSVCALADAEDLPAHGEAVRERLVDGE